MTTEDEKAGRRTGKVMRAARKLYGYTQQSVAELLGVSQPTLSNYESGVVIPSSRQWFQFCRQFELNPESSHETGIIDNCHPLAIESPYPDGRFNIPKKYLRYQGSKVRNLQPFFMYFARTLGDDALIKYFKSKKVDPDFFTVYDNQLNITFALELITALVDKGALAKKQIPLLASTVTTQEAQGRLYSEYQSLRTQKELLLRIIQNIAHYEGNFRYTIEDQKENSIFLAIEPTHKMRFFEYKTEAMGSFMCDYKKSYLSYFSTFLGGKPIEISEHECHFNGACRCLYEIKAS